MIAYRKETLERRIDLLPVLDLTWPEPMQKMWWEWFGDLLRQAKERDRRAEEPQCLNAPSVPSGQEANL